MVYEKILKPNKYLFPFIDEYMWHIHVHVIASYYTTMILVSCVYTSVTCGTCSLIPVDCPVPTEISHHQGGDLQILGQTNGAAADHHIFPHGLSDCHIPGHFDRLVIYFLNLREISIQ